MARENRSGQGHQAHTHITNFRNECKVHFKEHIQARFTRISYEHTQISPVKNGPKLSLSTGRARSRELYSLERDTGTCTRVCTSTRTSTTTSRTVVQLYYAPLLHPVCFVLVLFRAIFGSSFTSTRCKQT